jgi:centrosomal protein CEP104
MAQQPVKFKYRIIYCSSEDPQHPATELLDPTVNSKGWVSARYCEYPQEVILQFS